MLRGWVHRRFLVSGHGCGYWAIALEVAEEVSDLFLGEGVKQAVGHEGGVGDSRFLDVGLGDQVPLSLAVEEGEGVFGLVDDQAAENAAVGQGDGLGLVFLANEGAWIDQAFEQEVEVATFGAGEVGADRFALAEELVATCALLGEDRMRLGQRVSLVAFRQDATDLGDAGGPLR